MVAVPGYPGDAVPPAAQYILRLPGGMELRADSEQEMNAVYFRHSYLLVSEGICPGCETRLEPAGVPLKPGVIAGYCRRCAGYRSVDTLEETVCWSLAFNPHTGEPLVHPWMA